MRKTKKQPDAGDSSSYVFEIEGKPVDYERVTSIMQTATVGEAKGKMAYWGAKNATQFYAAVLDEYDYEDEWWEDFVASPLDPNKMLKEASARGKAAHKLFEQLMKGELFVEEDRMWVKGDPEGFPFIPMSYDLAAVKAYLAIYDPAMNIMSEQHVYYCDHGSPADCWDEVCTHGYAGTADLIAGSLVGDLKTHKPPARWTDFAQEGAYAQAWEQMTGQHIDSMMVILAREDGEFETAHGYMSPAVFNSMRVIAQEIKSFQMEAA